MTDLVVLKLGASPQEPVAWGAFTGATIDEAGRVADVASLGQIASRFPPEARIVAVLRGEQVAMREFAAPPKQTAKLIAAATLLLEDELAEPVDALHVAVTTDAPRAALAVSKAVLRDFIAAFDAAGVPVSEMTADYLCIGGSATACIIVGDQGRIIAARAGAGFAAETPLADLVAPAFIEAAGDAAIIAYGAHDPAGRWAHAPVERRPLPHEADVVALFGAHLSMRGASFNFLSGEFRRRQARRLNLGPWKRSAALAAGLAAAAVVSAAASGIRDARIASAFEDSASAMHRAAFPTYAGGDIKAHARQMLSAGVKSASFLEMTALLTASLEGHDGVAIDRIRYDAARGQFVFSIRSESDAGIEAFRASLASHGLVGVDSGGYRRSGSAFIGEMSASLK